MAGPLAFLWGLAFVFFMAGRLAFAGGLSARPPAPPDARCDRERCFARGMLAAAAGNCGELFFDLPAFLRKDQKILRRRVPHRGMTFVVFNNKFLPPDPHLSCWWRGLLW